MKPLNAIFTIAVAAALSRSAGAQALYAGVRAGTGIPSGDFSTTATGTGGAAFLRGASPGLGYGLDAGIGSPLFGFYASYDHIEFGCKSEACDVSGKYELKGYAAGVRASVPLLPLVRPWAKAGVTYNELTGTADSVSVSTGKGIGYEVGAGVDIPIMMGFLSLTPQVRRIRQRLSPNDGSKRAADYYTFDIGLRVRTPI